jgi:preprotein translocase subunit SecG
VVVVVVVVVVVLISIGRSAQIDLISIASLEFMELKGGSRRLAYKSG